MLDRLEIRDATQQDSPRIAVLTTASRAAAMPWLPVLHTPEQDLAFYSRQVRDLDARVATIDGQVVGVAIVDHAEAMLEHLYLDPDVRRRGIGRALLDDARRRHDGPLQLWCFADNQAARAFYAANGAIELYATDGSDNEERTPDVRLELPALEVDTN